MVERLEYIDFYRKDITNTFKGECFDVFISAFNESERITKSYKNINSEKKHYLLFSEYEFSSSPRGVKICNNDDLITFLKRLNVLDRICIDITGFIRPYLVFMIRALKKLGFNEVSFIYAEPVQYINHHETIFSKGERKGVSEITGFVNESGEVLEENKYMIVGNGFDVDAFIEVTNSYKIKTENQFLLIGFPSLKPDMFQQSMLQIHDLDKNNYSFLFAPASNPFMTAQKIETTVDSLKKENDEKISIYLAPLSTKPQVLGFALYAVRCERVLNSNVEINVIYPFSENYSHETSKGIAKIWMYKIDFLNDV